MTIFVYSNNGTSFRMEASDYVVQAGEVSFTNYATPEQLTAAFSGYAAAEASQAAIVAGKALLASGITVSSTLYPSLNGTYVVSQDSLLNMAGTVSYISAKGSFMSGSTMSWYDNVLTAHTFTSVTEFVAFAEAAAVWYEQVQIYILSGGTSGTLPSGTVTLP